MAKKTVVPDPENATRRSILEAAERELMRYGLKKTSMEGIAREAKVAKATVYAYFDSKEIVFDEVCGTVAAKLAAAAEEAAARAKAPEAAVIASLATKFCAIHSIARASPHGPELLTASLGNVGEKTSAAHATYVADLAALLARCHSVERKEAPELAEVLDRAAEGVVAKAASEEEVRRHLTVLVRRVLT